MATTNDVQKFILDGTEISIVDSTARTNASNAQLTANSANTAASNANTTANEAKSLASNAQSTANTANSTSNDNKTAISTINSTKVVKTCTYNSNDKSLTITTGNIGG